MILPPHAQAIRITTKFTEGAEMLAESTLIAHFKKHAIMVNGKPTWPNDQRPDVYVNGWRKKIGSLVDDWKAYCEWIDDNGIPEHELNRLDSRSEHHQLRFMQEQQEHYREMAREFADAGPDPRQLEDSLDPNAYLWASTLLDPATPGLLFTQAEAAAWMEAEIQMDQRDHGGSRGWAKLMTEEIREPIITFMQGSEIIVADGTHRIAAQIARGIPIKAIMGYPTETDSDKVQSQPRPA